MPSVAKSLFVIGIFTVVFAIGSLMADPDEHPLANSLLVNLLASGITVIGTTVLIDRTLRRARDKDAEPGFEMAQELLRQETTYLLGQIGIMIGKAQDDTYKEDPLDPRVGFHVALAKREKQQLEEGLRLAKSFERTQIIGKKSDIAAGVSYMTQRMSSAIDDILNNFSSSISNANRIELYRLKQELTQNNTYTGTGDDLSIVGYESPDDGYIPNNDYPEGYISSLHAYHIHKIILAAIRLHKLKLHLPV
jgi:hypothetical protein